MDVIGRWSEAIQFTDRFTTRTDRWPTLTQNKYLRMQHCDAEYFWMRNCFRFRSFRIQPCEWPLIKELYWILITEDDDQPSTNKNVTLKFDKFVFLLNENTSNHIYGADNRLVSVCVSCVDLLISWTAFKEPNAIKLFWIIIKLVPSTSSSIDCSPLQHCILGHLSSTVISHALKCWFDDWFVSPFQMEFSGTKMIFTLLQVMNKTAFISQLKIQITCSLMKNRLVF